LKSRPLTVTPSDSVIDTRRSLFGYLPPLLDNKVVSGNLAYRQQHTYC